MTVSGLDGLRRKLAKLPEAVRDAASDAIGKSAADLAAMQKRLAPVGRGDLRDSIGWHWGLPEGGLPEGEASRRGAGRIAAKAVHKLAATVSAGGRRAFYARFVEYGTRHAPARPFFWPAWRARRRGIRARISRAMNKAVREAARG